MTMSNNKHTNAINGFLANKKRKNFIVGLIFVLPWLIGFLFFGLYPILASFYYSFTDYGFFKSPQFCGLTNYIELLKDEKFWLSLKNTIFFTILVVPLQLFVSLMIASLLNMKIKYLSLFRTLFYIPSIIPTISAALLWIWILNGQYGILNTILGFVGLPQPGWLTDPNFTKISLIIMQVWGSGGIMVIYLAAIQDIPKSLYESSVIDGANSIQKFLKITIPSLAPVTLFQTIIATSAAFQYFAQAYIFSFGMDIHRSVGGPENSILFYSVYLYQNAFSFLKMGYASAMAWILFIIISLITYTIFRISDKSVYYGGE